MSGAEIQAVDELHGHEVVAVFLAEIEHRNDVGMAELRHGLRFALEPFRETQFVLGQREEN